jgi:pyrroline-5-carboxylate reductase
MKRIDVRVNRRVAVTTAAMALAMIGSPVSAQDGASSGGTSTTAIRPLRTQATERMIEEAIQRSKARSEKLRTTGRPEQFGSEEPFTFDPNR